MKSWPPDNTVIVIQNKEAAMRMPDGISPGASVLLLFYYRQEALFG
jgi:hypothetical protein